MDSFKCTKCIKSYKHQNALTAHQRMHDGTVFACELCEKRFYQKSTLEEHRIAHTFAKSYACDVDGCRKKFIAKSVMQQHKRTVHETVRENACEQCDRRFGTKINLATHRRMHTGERPYACTECAMRFSRPSRNANGLWLP